MNLETKGILEAVIARLKENPQRARGTRRITAEWVGGMACEVRIGNRVVITDEGRSLGGTERGPDPASLPLAGLASCTATAFVLMSALMEIPIESVEVSVTADLDLRGSLGAEEGVPSGYTDIRYEARIKSSASDERIRELAAAAERMCPVHDTLTRPHRITGELSLNGRPLS